MKLVIDITEQEYNDCKNLFNMVYQEGYLNYNLNTALIMYIANGTSLSEELEKIEAEIMESCNNIAQEMLYEQVKEIRGAFIKILKEISELKGEKE